MIDFQYFPKHSYLHLTVGPFSFLRLLLVPKSVIVSLSTLKGA